MHDWSEKRREELDNAVHASTTSDIRCKVLIGRGRVRISEQCVFNTNTNTKTKIQKNTNTNSRMHWWNHLLAKN